MRYFKVDPTRSQLVVPIKFYQMNLMGAINRARKTTPDLLVNGDDTLPTWSKFAKDPLKAAGFWQGMIEAMFYSRHNLPEIDIQRQLNKVQSPFQVVMMFLPGSLSNSALADVVNLTQQSMRGWKVLEISGAAKYNGKRIKNKNAEKITRNVIDECRETNTPVLILSRGMAQRSYSVGEIDTLILAYDNGEVGATTQKISRALTPSDIHKVGRIFSLSFDPNKDDKFDTMLLAAAANISHRKSMEIDRALRAVIETVDIFSCGPDGASLIKEDEYLAQVLDRNSLTRVLGQQSVPYLLTKAEADLLFSSNSGYARLTPTDKTDKGKTTNLVPHQSALRSQIDNTEQKFWDKVRKVLTTIVEHLPYITVMTGHTDIKEALKCCSTNQDYNDYIVEEFGFGPMFIIDLFDRGVINYELAMLTNVAKVSNLKRVS